MREELIFYSMNDNKIIFDVESTGLDAENNYIAQLSYIIIGSGIEVSKNFFFKVPKMELGAEKTHGLSIEKLAKLSNGNTFKDYADEILNDFKSCNLCIGHNVSFDLKFIKKEFERIGIKINYIQDRIYCTMKEYTDVLKLKGSKYGGYKWPKLSEVVDYLNMDEQKLLDYTKKIYNIASNEVFNGYHDSRFDVICTYMIYISINCYDENTKEILYYVESPNNRNKNKETKKSRSNIFKDLFSFKGEIESKKYTDYIWIVVILIFICKEIVKHYVHNEVQYQNEMLELTLLMMLVASYFSLISLTIKRIRTKKKSFWKIICLIIPLVNLIFISNLCSKTTQELSLEVKKKSNKKFFMRTGVIIGLIAFICAIILNLPHGEQMSGEDAIIEEVKNYSVNGRSIEDEIKDTINEEISYGWNVNQIYENTYFVYYEYDNDNSLDNGTRMICYEYYSIDNEVTPVTGELKEFYIKSGHILKNSELIIGDLPAYLNI